MIRAYYMLLWYTGTLSLLRSWRGFFDATMRRSQGGDCYIERKVLIFFKNGQLFYVIFKSYPSFLKYPEFMTLGVSKHA